MSTSPAQSDLLGTVRLVTLRYRALRYGTVRDENVAVRQYTTQVYVTVLVRCGTVRFYTVRYGTVRYVLNAGVPSLSYSALAKGATKPCTYDRATREPPLTLLLRVTATLAGPFACCCTAIQRPHPYTPARAFSPPSPRPIKRRKTPSYEVKTRISNNQTNRSTLTTNSQNEYKIKCQQRNQLYMEFVYTIPIQTCCTHSRHQQQKLRRLASWQPTRRYLVVPPRSTIQPVNQPSVPISGSKNAARISASGVSPCYTCPRDRRARESSSTTTVIKTARFNRNAYPYRYFFYKMLCVCSVCDLSTLSAHPMVHHPQISSISRHCCSQDRLNWSILLRFFFLSRAVAPASCLPLRSS